MSLLPHIEKNPTQTARFTVILLHGLGADGNDFAPLVPELHLPESLPVRFIFPHAPSLPVTINGGMVMPAWYDIKEMSIDRSIDTPQLKASANEVYKFIENEIARGVPADHIILAGFSQGGAVAYEAALEGPHRVRGLIALSTYLATHQTLKVPEDRKDLPVFIGHGLMDPIVPELLGRRAVEFLEGKGIEPRYKTYPMDHSVCIEEIQDIRRFLMDICEDE